eukprot:5139695-Pleurochrysis_carterae.AAC.1
MGTQPASNICSRFSEEYLDAFRARFDEYVARHWLPRQPLKVQRHLAERARRLGAVHARPYWADV